MIVDDSFNTIQDRMFRHMFVTWVLLVVFFWWMGSPQFSIFYGISTYVMLVGPEEENGETDLTYGSY